MYHCLYIISTSIVYRVKIPLNKIFFAFFCLQRKKITHYKSHIHRKYSWIIEILRHSQDPIVLQLFLENYPLPVNFFTLINAEFDYRSLPIENYTRRDRAALLNGIGLNDGSANLDGSSRIKLGRRGVYYSQGISA